MENNLNDGIDVIVNEEVLSKSPVCPHGPTLLFERCTKLGRRSFYACSACRDRKTCRFFQWADEHKSSKQSLVHEATSENRRVESWKKIKKNLDENGQLSFCKSCSLVIIDSDELVSHSKHDICQNVSKKVFQLPTYLIQPTENNKKEAQYYFTSETTEFIISTLKRLNFTSVMCLGCPRIFERLVQDTCFNSVLLDIDERLCQFYSPQQLVVYNMFNHHFFDGLTGKAVYENFLKSATDKKFAIMIDPPFGGMVEPLAFTLSRIGQDWHSLNSDLCDDSSPAVFWMFPYFLEKKILDACSMYNMLDYQVEYENHRCFKKRGNEASQRVSPIRIFTNLAPELIILPESESYRFCGECKRYISKLNRHCTKCNNCTSKSGKPYFHCDLCQLCVKSGYKHCNTCASCFPVDHKCGQVPKFKTGCHNCGNLGHKKGQCKSMKRKRLQR
ncbi:rRNA N6-adenosine-methyltransferase zcchc4 [Chamberlinius hualienensis]